MLRGKKVPSAGFGIVLRHTIPKKVKAREVALSPGDALLCCQSVPMRGLAVILRNTLALVIHQSDVKLGGGVPVKGCLPKFLKRSFKVTPIKSSGSLVKALRLRSSDGSNKQHG